MMLNSQYTCIHINFYTHMSTLFVTVTLIFYIVIKLLRKYVIYTIGVRWIEQVDMIVRQSGSTWSDPLSMCIFFN